MNNERTQIVVYGIGGVGGYFGGLIARSINSGPAGTEQVNFIARGEHLKQIQDKGLLVKLGSGEEFRAFPNTASDDPTPLPIIDVLFLCVKAYDLDEALDKMRDKIFPHTLIIPLMNGVDIRDRIIRKLDRGIVMPTCVYVSSRVSAPGEITQIGPEGTILTGNRKGTRDVYPESILKLALACGLNLRWSDDPEFDIWNKYLFIASFALVTAAYKLSIGEVLVDSEARSDVEGLMGEIVALGKLRDIEFPEDVIPATLEKAATFPAETRTSFQQDVEAGKAHTEIDIFGGTLIKMGCESAKEMVFLKKILDRLGNVPS
ncbi:MAG: 2-dehydropantoate 2-reductase [Spirochaetales bacterium]|nr:2-dehydropantoate 2-reductase [Spirochaetales bacterium]